MRYLILATSYNNNFLYDEFDNDFNIETLKLPSEFILKISEWNSEYKKIIPLSTESRKLKYKEIEDLDSQGIHIAQNLKALMSNEIKIKYFSEGKLEFKYI